MELEEINDEVGCSSCTVVLSEPYIKCFQCSDSNVHLCLQCFANGVEFGTHESNHPYFIVRNDFSLFEERWTAVEETMLLKSVEECGYGNWKEISDNLKTKSKTECERHYIKHYIESPVESLPEFPDPNICYPPTPLVFKLCEDPPRPPEGSSLFNDMGGYSAARGDFNVEYDNYAELDISQIDDVDDDEFSSEDRYILQELRFAATEIYHSCLRERDRRKKIIRDYGILNYPKIFNVNKRFERTIRQWIDGLKSFCSLFNPMEYDQYLEALHYEKELKHEIERLQEYRRNGITRLRNVRLFKTLKKRREVTGGRRHLLSDLLTTIQDDDACKSWLQRQAFIETMSKGVLAPLPSAPRKTPAPLDITGYPGYEKLSVPDRELCASTRLVPEAFMEFKRLLMKECHKLGCLKLAQARSLIKIDVNKTRKLYDYLINDGSINKEPIT